MKPISTFSPTVVLSLFLLLMMPSGTEASPVERYRGFQDLLDAVVRIDVWETRYSGGAQTTTRGVGSGVIMTAEGHVLTNAHVVSPKAERILVTLASLERVEAELIGWDHWTDLAVIRLDLEDMAMRSLDFATARFGHSASVLPAQTVYAVGTPNGLTRTVSRGIVSNTNRFFEGASIDGYETGLFNTWLQTDAAINPGNSGGPLVTERGQVIGINTRGYMGANNLGFAVPGDIAREVMTGLIERGSITRSYIGIVAGPLQDLEDFFQLELNRGMLVQSVDIGSPAERAGLRAGDIVLALVGETLDGRFPEQLPPIQKRIASVPVGSTLELTVLRNGKERLVEVVTEELLTRVGEDWVFKQWGLSVREVSRSEAREERLETESGVRITGIQPAFPAAEAGLRNGDIVVAVNRLSLAGLEDLKAIYAGFEEEPQAILLEISRNFETSFVVLKP